MTHDSSTLQAAIARNHAELNNAILKLTAHDELVRQNISYVRMSFFLVAAHALYNDTFSHAIRVLDEHKQAMSFWYVLRCNEAVVKRKAKSANLDLEELKALSTKLRLVREKTQFHIDRMSVTAPKSVWDEAAINGNVFGHALTGMANTLALTKQELFGGELETVTDYDASDIPKIVKSFETVHGRIHGA